MSQTYSLSIFDTSIGSIQIHGIFHLIQNHSSARHVLSYAANYHHLLLPFQPSEPTSALLDGLMNLTHRARFKDEIEFDGKLVLK
jgi:hypothetical protein